MSQLVRKCGKIVLLMLGGILIGPAKAEVHKSIECSGSNLCIDVASDPAGFELPIEPGNYTIRFVNVIPAKAYRIVIKKSRYVKIVDPLPSPVSVQSDDACPKAMDALRKEYNAATTEGEISSISQSLDTKLGIVCGPETATTVKEFKAVVLNKTTKVVDRPTTVSDQEKLDITIERVDDKGAVEATFGTYTYATPRKAPGQWLVLYGVNYIQADDEEYFSKANADTAPPTYTVTKKSDAGGSTFAPSLYFMWIQEDMRKGFGCALSCNSNDIFWGVTGGIGFDFDSPTAFLGYGVGWGYNLMLTGGVAMSKVARLDGKYRAGDVINENLSEDQLSEETYEPNLYVGLAFRFGSNPFKKDTATPAPAAQ